VIERSALLAASSALRIRSSSSSFLFILSSRRKDKLISSFLNELKRLAFCFQIALISFSFCFFNSSRQRGVMFAIKRLNLLI
jgi:hypothetical protein